LTVPSVLIVEDEILIAMSLEVELKRAGYPVCGIATRGEEAVAMALKFKPGAILMDIGLAGEMSGFTAAEKIQEEQNTPIVFVSGHMDEANLARAAEFKPLACVSKPVSFARLRAALETTSQP
jgi:DNA-binding response OmpR family regulator